MKDVVTAAQAPVLVTGFGAFPGAPSNPTLEILQLLGEEGVAEVALALAPLPVTFVGVAPALRAAAASRPRAILMLGLARRRKTIAVETQARNRVGTAVPDAGGVVPAQACLVEEAPVLLAARWPAAAVRTALLAQGHEATLSEDAGDYVCNAALFHALHERLAPTIGFLHVPPLDARGVGQGPTAESLAAATRVAIAAMVSPMIYSAAARAG